MNDATVTAAGPAAEAPQAERKPLWARIPAPWYFSTLATLILVLGEWQASILGGYERLAIALGTAIGLEIVLSLLLRRRFPSILSAYISGNSVCILLKPQGNLEWPFFLAAALAISSKYVLAIRGRHLWNPTNFSIGALLLLAPGSISVLSHQYGNSAFAIGVIYSVGLLVATRARVLHLSVTYVVSFALLAFTRSGLDFTQWNHEISPLTGPMYTLFIFFMITDPRTVVRSRGAQYVVCVLIALTDALIRTLGDAHVGWIEPLLPAPPIFALFLVGPIAKAIDVLRDPRPPARPPGPTR